jgi:hypothetical protein
MREESGKDVDKNIGMRAEVFQEMCNRKYVVRNESGKSIGPLWTDDVL